MVMLYPYVFMMEFRLFSVQFMRHVMNMAFMIDANTLYMYIGTTLQKPPMMVVFQKRWPVMRGKINMILKEWCMEMDRISQI